MRVVSGSVRLGGMWEEDSRTDGASRWPRGLRCWPCSCNVIGSSQLLDVLPCTNKSKSSSSLEKQLYSWMEMWVFCVQLDLVAWSVLKGSGVFTKDKCIDNMLVSILADFCTVHLKACSLD